ncbi:MAG: hypothetical protein FWE40_06505 [Oscillospiraceae bacterium]|nr:hypothetical protein [Oscillospiraceae bacterium]
MIEWIGLGLAALAIGATVLGSIFALCQWRKQLCIRRTEFTHKIMHNMMNDLEINTVRHEIEHGKFQYDEFFHHLPLHESRKYEKLFSLYNYICYLKHTRAIGENEFSIFYHKITWTLKNFAVQEYLWNLYHFCNECKNCDKHGICNFSDKCQNYLPCAYQYLIEFGLKSGKFLEGFHDVNCKFFKRRLGIESSETCNETH